MILQEHVAAIEEAASNIFEQPFSFESYNLIGSETELAVDIHLDAQQAGLGELNAFREEAGRITGDAHIYLSVASYTLYRVTITII